jgi:hypothetical protein
MGYAFCFWAACGIVEDLLSVEVLSVAAWNQVPIDLNRHPDACVTELHFQV